MIHEFGKRKRVLFPTKWANSVGRWISGICSPSGTVRVGNDMDPGNGPSLRLDVNIPEVLKHARTELGDTYVLRKELTNLLSGMCDGQSIIMKDGVLTVNREWLRYNN